MRSEPDQLERFVVWLAINEDKVWTDMTVSMVFPVAGQRMVAETGVEGQIVGEALKEFGEFVLQ